MLRLLRGCYHPMQPYWTAGAGALATSGSSMAPRNEAQSVPRTVRGDHVPQPEHRVTPGAARPHAAGALPAGASHATSASGWCTSWRRACSRPRARRRWRLSELPHAGQLIEVLAEVAVCMAAHAAVSVEVIIMPFLKFRKRNDASAAYAMACARWR